MTIEQANLVVTLLSDADGEAIVSQDGAEWIVTRKQIKYVAIAEALDSMLSDHFAAKANESPTDETPAIVEPSSIITPTS